MPRRPHRSSGMPELLVLGAILLALMAHLGSLMVHKSDILVMPTFFLDEFHLPIGAPRLLAGHRLSLKQAQVDDLLTLPDIGPKTAEAILKYREQRGGIKQVRELLRVPGIGPKTFRKLSPYLEI